jgi:hypothetical protein
MLTRDTVLAAMKAGLMEAARAAARLPEAQMKDVLFSLWSETVHRLLIGEDACGCTNGREDLCFAAFPKDRRLALVGDGLLSFVSFVDIVKEARAEFLGVLTEPVRTRTPA